jgi:ketosteroid isomerase-like protein
MGAGVRPEKFGTGLDQIQMVVELLCLARNEVVDLIPPLLHPEMQVLPAPGVAPARSYTNRQEFLAYFSDARTNGVRVEPEVREIRVTATGAVLVCGSLRMDGPDGEDEIPAWFVYTFRDGLIATLENHLDRAMAEEAAGLSPGSSITA